MINQHKTLRFLFIGMTSVFPLESCQGDGGWRRGRGEDTRRSEEWRDFRLLCLLLHVLVCCRDSFHLAYKYQARVREMANFLEMIRHLEAFHQSTCSQLRLLPCACAKVTAKERGNYAAMHKYYLSRYSWISKTTLCCFISWFVK